MPHHWNTRAAESQSGVRQVLRSWWPALVALLVLAALTVAALWWWSAFQDAVVTKFS